MLNAAIVGLGRWGRRLVGAVQEGGQPLGERIRFTHGVTRTLAKAADFANEQQLHLGDDYEAVLADQSIGAVVLATPHSQHAAQITEAAAAGKHVFVEKPFTMTKASAETAAAAATRAGIVLAVGHNRRFLPAMEELKLMIDGGELGTILHVEGNFSGMMALGYTKDMWRSTVAESPAGGMTSMGIHTVDTFIHLCGKLASVRAHSLRQVLQVETDDTTSVMLRFATGQSALLSTLQATARQWRIQVFGTKGWAHMRDHNLLDVAAVGGKPKPRTYPKIDIERAELEAFAEAAAGGAPYRVPLDQAVHGVAVLEAIVASAARGGAEVAVP